MRSILLKRSLFLVSVFLNILMLISCKKQAHETPSQVSMYEIIKEDKVAFTFLKAAVDRAGMQEVLQNEQLTFIAPTNTAFINAGYKSIKIINETDPALLANLLRYHILTGREDLAVVADGAKLMTANSQQILVIKSNDKTSLNGAIVTAFNLNATNGTLCVVDKLLVPVAGNLMQTIEADPNLLFFKTALLRASTGNTNMVQLLNGNTDYTVFALSNLGFTKSIYTTLALINAADPNTLATFLSYYITTGKKFSTQFTDRSQSVQLNQGRVYYDLTPTNTLIDGQHRPLSNSLHWPLVNGVSLVAGSNQQATNGIIHVLDGVLTPATGTLYQKVADLGLTYLAAAINKASTGNTNIAAILSGSDEYTLIAAGNAAFVAAGYATVVAVNAADANILAEILKLHMIKIPRYIPGIYVSSDATTLYNYKTLAEKNITFQFITPSYMVKGPGNNTNGVLSPNNYTCTNGVLHISSILLN